MYKLHLLNGLIVAAKEAKVKILSGITVIGIERSNKPNNDDNSWLWMLHLSDGSELLSQALIIAAGPRDVYELLKNTNEISTHFLSRIAKESKPVGVATLDIALSTSSQSRHLWCIWSRSTIISIYTFCFRQTFSSWRIINSCNEVFGFFGSIKSN